MAQRPAHHAAVDDSRTWSPFVTALAAVRAGDADGVGLVLGDGVVGIDFDHVRAPRTGVVDDDVMGMVALLNSYTEVSPSGEGLHVLASGALPLGGRRRGQIEMYDGGRFFTLTGRHVAGTPCTLEERTQALAALHARIFATAEPPAPVAAAPVSSTRRICGDDVTLLARAHAARNGQKFAALWRGDADGYASRSEADLALCGMLAFWTGGDAHRIDHLFRASGLFRAKWDSRRGKESYGARTITAALRR
jgi:primase-polymerase (primpol)-like protein